MSLQTCNYYVTFRCNATCEFCNIWQGKEQAEPAASEVEPEALGAIRKLGVKYLNITGGEPFLREDLPQILKHAKDLGFFISLTTNGLLYRERGKPTAGLIDRLYFSLDYPMEEEHDRSRGIDCFYEVMAAIDLAKEWGEKPIINFTMTRDSVRFLPEMVELAERKGVFVYLYPVYDFYGTQGFESMTFEHIRYYARRKKVLQNRAVIEFVKAGGNKVFLPRCHARETVVTLLPDGTRVSPCFFNPGGRQGREDVCSSCMRWDYMLPSFTQGLDKYFGLNLYSDWENRNKLRREKT